MTSHTVTYAFTVLLISSLMSQVSSYPQIGRTSDNSRMEPEQYTDVCKTDEGVETLCQTCAKETRSNIVYPMCCEGREEARSWCDKYLEFGKS